MKKYNTLHRFKAYSCGCLRDSVRLLVLWPVSAFNAPVNKRFCSTNGKEGIYKCSLFSRVPFKRLRRVGSILRKNLNSSAVVKLIPICPVYIIMWKEFKNNMYVCYLVRCFDVVLGVLKGFYSTSLPILTCLFEVCTLLVLRGRHSVVRRYACDYNVRDVYHYDRYSINYSSFRRFATLSNKFSGLNTMDKGCLNMFPEEIINVFKTRVSRPLTYIEGVKINQPNVMEMLRRVQELMSEEGLDYEPSGRSGMLATESWFLRSALTIIQNKQYNNWERQVGLEMLSMHYESWFIREILKSMQEGDSKVIPGLTVKVLNKSLPHFIEVLNAFLDNHSKSLDDVKVCSDINVKGKLTIILHMLGAVAVASIVFTNVVRLSGSSGGAEEMTLINHVFDSLHTHFRFAVLKGENIPKALQPIWMNLRDQLLTLTSLEKVELGQGLVDMCLNSCEQVFNKGSIMLSSKERVNIITIKNELLVELSELAFNPVRLPMIHKPVEWSLSHDAPSGGYLHPVYNELVNRKGLVHPEVGSNKRSEIGQDQINAVNFLNGQEFIVNEDMLDYLLSEWEREDSIIFSIYNKPSPEEKYTPTVQKHNSVYWLYRNILNIALLFRGEVFHLPVFMDFRGRIYPLVSYLSYQGGDVARSLLNFNPSPTGKTTDNQHLLIYLCNVFGHNNRSMEGRIKWAKNTLPRMADLYVQDRGKFEEEYLIKAKEKAQFMSCFLSLYKSFLSTNDRPHSYSDDKTPVLFDATCSGMQHLSALTTNIDLAALVNLTNHKLNDFYGYCADIVNQVVSGLDDENLRKALSKLRIDRKLIKLPVMTIPYNIGLERLSEKITDKFVTRFEDQGDGKKKLSYIVPGELTVDGEELVLTGHEAGKLGSIIYHTVTGLMPPIKPLKKYFEGMLDVLEKLNQPIFWITPAGMKVWGSEMDTIHRRVKTSILKNSKPITIRIPTDKYAYNSIKRGFIANFIHSLDAANIHYLIKIIIETPEYKHQNLKLYTIHDCFASVNEQMHLIEDLVRKAFSSLYFEQNYLAELDTCLMGQIKTYCNDVQTSKNGDKTVSIKNPETGKVEVFNIPSLPVFNWDVHKEYLKEQIIRAEYFIS